MNTKEVKKYLKYLKFKKFYKPKLKACELCGSKNTKLLRKKFHGIIINLEFCQFIVAKIVDFYFKIQGLVKNFILITIKKLIET